MYRRVGELQEHMVRKREMLEQRVRELQALNALFRRHLEERSRSRQAYGELAKGMQQLVAEAQRPPLLLEERLQEPAPRVVLDYDMREAA